MGKIKVGIIGVGNCFAGLAQGIEYYKRNPEREVVGIMHDKIGGYSIHDIEFVCGFDVAENKVGKPLAQAIYSEPNEVRWVDSVSNCSGNVHESPVLDGIGIYMQNRIVPVKTGKSEMQLKEEALKEIKRGGARILLNYLPVGSQKATEFWANVALEAGCAFVNNMPVFIASTPAWAKRFAERKLPVIGDDIKSQLGSTIVHRVMTKLCVDRGIEIDKTYQINVGGNSVTGDQMIMLLVDGKIVHAPIGEFIDGLMEKNKITRADGKEMVVGAELPQTIECLTVDENYEVKIVPVDAFIRHGISEPVFEIETEEGRRVKITKDHNVFVLNDEGELEAVPVKDLKERESFIAVPASLPVEQREKKTLDLAPYAKELHAEGIENGFLKIHGHPEIKIPAQFPVTDGFLQIAGMWLADGSYDREGSANLELACGNEQECVELVDEFCEGLNINYVSRGKDGIALRLMSKTLANICKTCFGMKGDTYTKRVPGWVFELSERQVAQVLKGYVSGDGGITGRQVRWSSVSEGLVEDLRTLFLRIGIGSTAFKEKYPEVRKNAFQSAVGYCWHGLITSQPDLGMFAEKVGFLQAEKNARLMEVLAAKRKVKTTRRIPNLHALRWVWRVKSTTWTRNPTVEAEVVLGQLDKIGDGKFRERMRRVCEGDVKFLKVRRVRELPREGIVNVYDLSTKPYERFICSNILVHNTDFINMLERERLESKKISKTEAVQSQLKTRLPDDRIYVGPSDFIPFLGNRKLAFIRIEGKMFADVPFDLEMRLNVDDKANSGGTTIEAIRCCQLALERGLGGEINSASAYLMKHPPRQMGDSEARDAVNDFISGKRKD